MGWCRSVAAGLAAQKRVAVQSSSPQLEAMNRLVCSSVDDPLRAVCPPRSESQESASRNPDDIFRVNSYGGAIDRGVERLMSHGAALVPLSMNSRPRAEVPPTLHDLPALLEQVAAP